MSVHFLCIQHDNTQCISLSVSTFIAKYRELFYLIRRTFSGFRLLKSSETFVGCAIHTVKQDSNLNNSFQRHFVFQ